MKRWGIVVTAFYALAVAVLFVPGFISLIYKHPTVQGILGESLQVYGHWLIWIWVGFLASGQALLLFLSVDTSWRRAKPRQHIAVTAALVSFFTALLSGCILFSIAAAIYGDKPPELIKDWTTLVWAMIVVCIGSWIFWGGIFYHYYRDSSNIVSALVAWSLKGSVLELLIAVPAHVIVRQRGDCSAPIFTSFGIVTGIAIMLLSFGPGVLALYKKRLDAYPKNRANAGPAS